LEAGEIMTVLVVGATGATGRLLVAQLLERGHAVRVVVRSAEGLPWALREHPALSVLEKTLLDLPDAALEHLVADCGAVACCLGHNMTLRGVFGPPYRLVTEATRRLCAAVRNQRPARPVRYVLMNTVGNRHRGLHEPVSPGQRAVIALVRWLVPPHADNEQAAEYLRREVGGGAGALEWVVVRPDSLQNAEEVGAYTLHPSPTRSAIFNPGKTSRINVAHFMAALISEDDTWAKWKGQMPVIYNAGHD
jgi:nucleoside-diphosphate-sugar epimerase